MRLLNRSLVVLVLIAANAQAETTIISAAGRFMAQEKSGSAPKTAGDLSALAWMAGNWSGIQDGLEMEEFWMAPKGNTMLGLHRDVAGGQTKMFEFLRIESAADGITFWGSPRGQTPTPFQLKEMRTQHVVFENAEHDFPQRVIYWLSKDGMLHAKIEGMIKGKLASEEWAWKRN